MAFTSTVLSIVRFQRDRSEAIDAVVSATGVTAELGPALLDFAYAVGQDDRVSVDGVLTLATSVTGTVLTLQVRTT